MPTRLKMKNNPVEETIISIALSYSHLFPTEVKPAYFSNKLFQQMWIELEKLHSKRQAWDISLLYLHFEQNKKAQEFIRDFVLDEFVPESLLESYILKLKEEYKKRIVISIMNEVEEEFGHYEPYEFQARLAKKLAENEDDKQAVSSKIAMLELCKNLEKAKEEGGLTGITTGISIIDSYFNGFQPSRLYILAARPSMGKSALMLNFALSAAKDGNSVYVHCLEESLNSFSTRMLSNNSGIDNDSLQRGKFQDSAWDKIHSSIHTLSQLPIRISDSASITAEKLCNSIRAQNLKSPIDIVFIDHIQDLQKKSDSWHHDISEACGLFKSLAKELRIPVVVISQLSRGVEAQSDKKPLLSHLKESGDLEAKADVIMLLYREAYYKPEADKTCAELFVAKNRDGKTGGFKLKWNSSILKFSTWTEF